MATNMNRIWKILLYVIGAIFVLFVLVVAWWWFTTGSEQNAFLRALEQKNRQTSVTNTAVSYYFKEDGTIATQPASSLVDLKINGSDQPLRTKAPFSFTLTWKIDPSVDLHSCDLRGPDSRGLFGGIWLGDVKTHEGSLRFENVMLGDKVDENGFYPTAPLYNGFASFIYGGGGMTIRSNFIYMGCSETNKAGRFVSISDGVDIWIDR